MSVVMWKVAFWFLQFPAETCALHAVCVFGHLLLAVQRSRCRAILKCEASVPIVLLILLKQNIIGNY